jgi:hypothetical protein
MPTARITMSRRIAHNGWPHDRTRLRRSSAMHERRPGGTRRASPAAVSTPWLRHHRPRHRGDDTNPDDHARPARTEQAARGPAGQPARASSDRRVQPAVTTADYQSPAATRAERGALPRHNDSSTLASVPVARAFGPSLQTLAPDETRACRQMLIWDSGPPRWRADPPPPARPPGRATIGWRVGPPGGRRPLGLKPIAVPAEVQRPQPLARLTDQVTLMGTSS